MLKSDKVITATMIATILSKNLPVNKFLFESKLGIECETFLIIE